MEEFGHTERQRETLAKLVNLSSKLMKKRREKKVVFKDSNKTTEILYSALSHPMGVSKRLEFFLQVLRTYILKYETYSFIAPCKALQGAVAQYAADQIRNTGANPPLFFDKCTGLFNVHYTTHRTNGFTSHLKEAAIMVKCLA